MHAYPDTVSCPPRYLKGRSYGVFPLFPGAPTIIVEPVETVVDAGTTLVLNCQAEGEPTPVIEWSRQGRPLLSNDRFSTLSNGSLRVSSAQKEDTAEYECVARNLLGSVLVRVTLTVRGESNILFILYIYIFFIDVVTNIHLK